MKRDTVDSPTRNGWSASVLTATWAIRPPQRAEWNRHRAPLSPLHQSDPSRCYDRRH